MKSCIYIFLLILAYVNCMGQTITASSGWTVTIPASTLTEAGSDYTTNATSATNQTLITLRSRAGIFTFTVSIHKIDVNWNTGLTLWARRTGTGTSTGSTTGGTAYQQLTNTAQYFFSGTTPTNRRRNNIPIQYEIRGLSVILPARTYSTTVVYTLSN